MNTREKQLINILNTFAKLAKNITECEGYLQDVFNMDGGAVGDRLDSCFTTMCNHLSSNYDIPREIFDYLLHSLKILTDATVLPEARLNKVESVEEFVNYLKNDYEKDHKEDLIDNFDFVAVFPDGEN